MSYIHIVNHLLYNSKNEQKCQNHQIYTTFQKQTADRNVDAETRCIRWIKMQNNATLGGIHM